MQLQLFSKILTSGYYVTTFQFSNLNISIVTLIKTELKQIKKELIFTV